MADRTVVLSLRVPEQVKAQLERAAEDDMRTLSSLVTKVLVEWLKANAPVPEKGDKPKKR